MDLCTQSSETTGTRWVIRTGDDDVRSELISRHLMVMVTCQICRAFKPMNLKNKLIYTL
jgi:hypothetical protein